MALPIVRELLREYVQSLFNEKTNSGGSGLSLVNYYHVVSVIIGCSSYIRKTYIDFMGIVNNQFSRIQSLKSKDEPDCAVRLINMYLVDVERILSELTRYSELPDIDYSRLSVLAHEIQENSSWIGAEHVKHACNNLIEACNRMQKQNFILALDWIKNEFSHTRIKLESFVQTERKIIRLQSNQSNSQFPAPNHP